MQEVPEFGMNYNFFDSASIVRSGAYRDPATSRFVTVAEALVGSGREQTEFGRVYEYEAMLGRIPLLEYKNPAALYMGFLLRGDYDEVRVEEVRRNLVGWPPNQPHPLASDLLRYCALWKKFVFN
jgi:hypothetical protein